MRRFVIVYALLFFAVKSELQIDSQDSSKQQILIDNTVHAEPRKLPDKVSTNQIFIQQPDQNGDNVYVAHGPANKIPGNPKTGEPDMLPPNSLTAIIGQTPLHTNYQVIHYPRFKTTPLNLESYPRIYTPQFSPQHPLNMHHPFNNLYGMHPYMFTGDPTSAANLFMNPFAHAMTGMFANNNFPTASALNGAATKVSTDESNNQQPQAFNQSVNQGSPVGFGSAMPMGNPMNLNFNAGFNPAYAGMGLFGGGMGASNPSMSSLGPWAYLSPKNIGDETVARKLKKRRIAAKKKQTKETQNSPAETVTAENNKA